MTKLVIQFFLTVLLGSPSAYATTWYVNSAGGNDSYNGTTLATAFLTPQHAASVTVAGDTVDFLGTFGGGTSGIAPLIITTSGTPGHPITYQSYYNGNNGPRAVFNGTRSQGVIQGLYPLSYITINNLEIVGWSGALTWAGASANSGVAGTGWQNLNYIGGGTFFGGGVNGQILHHISFTNNLVHDFPGGGLGCAFCDYVTVSGNTVYNTSSYGPYANSGISLYELHNIDTGTGTKNNINNNIVFNNVNYIPEHSLIAGTTTSNGNNPAGNMTLAVASSALANYTEAVIDVSQGCIAPGTVVSSWGPGYIGLSQPETCNIPNGSTIQLGTITDGEGIIIDNNNNSQSDGIAYVGRTLVTMNLVANNGNSGLEAGPGSLNVDFTFNTLYLNQTSFANTSAYGAANGDINLNGTGFNVANNIVVSAALVPSCWDRSSGTTIWSNNDCYGGSSVHPIPGTNNISVNPNFVAPSINPRTGNFQLQPGSPAIDVGSGKYTRSTDLLGNPGLAGATYDMGAYESVCTKSLAPATNPCSP